MSRNTALGSTLLLYRTRSTSSNTTLLPYTSSCMLMAMERYSATCSSFSQSSTSSAQSHALKHCLCSKKHRATLTISCGIDPVTLAIVWGSMSLS